MDINFEGGSRRFGFGYYLLVDDRDDWIQKFEEVLVRIMGPEFFYLSLQGL